MANELAGKVLAVTTTSFQDTPGKHHQLLEESGCELIRFRGPMTEEQLVEALSGIDKLDAAIVGDDAWELSALKLAREKGATQFAKYGIGLDAFDLEAFRSVGIGLTNTPGVNQTTVSEHAFGLLIDLTKKISEHNAIVRAGDWKRMTGQELAGKTISILGFGRIGQEMARRALAFGMNVIAYSPSWREPQMEFEKGAAAIIESGFFNFYNTPPTFKREEDLSATLKVSDVISLHMPITPKTIGFFNAELIGQLKENAIVVNTARGKLINEQEIADALNQGKLAGYATDVLAQEPSDGSSPLLTAKNCVMTPHVGSRTNESVERQATRAVTNIIAQITDGEPEVWVQKAS